MNSIERRIERAEEALGMGQEPITVNIVWFGGEPVPPDERRDNTIVHHVRYEAIRKQLEEGAAREH